MYCNEYWIDNFVCEVYIIDIINDYGAFYTSNFKIHALLFLKQEISEKYP